MAVTVKKTIAPARKKPLLIGGGVALAAMASVMTWALVSKGDEPKPTAPSTTSAPAAAKINLTAAAGIEDSANAAADEPVAKATPTAKSESPSTPSKTSTAMAGFVESPKVLPPVLTKEILERCKKSAVMIEAGVDRGAAEGSGWFAEPGIIVTNAHVVMMDDAAMPPPHYLRIKMYVGTKDQQQVTGKLLALDREHDLAVISVKSKNLPDPLPIAPSAELFEGQGLHVLGFPLGSQLAMVAEGAATTISVRNSTLAGRIHFHAGGVRWLQLEGGADHGNSGGAIFDNAGLVRSILVAGRPGTNIRWSIPTEYAVDLLQGRVLKLVPGQAFRQGDVAKQPLTAMVADPMKRIKKVTLDIWAGEPGKKVRPRTETRPMSVAGDSPRSECALAYNPDALVPLGEAHPATGECDLPPLREGQVYWVQPKYERIDGSTRWGEAVVAGFCGLPVDRVPANLALKLETGTEKKISIESKFGQGFVPDGAPPRVRELGLKAQLKERVRQKEPEGTRVVYVYDEMGFLDQQMNEATEEVLGEMFKAAKGLSIETIVTDRGLIKTPKANLVQVPARFRPRLANFNAQIMQSIEQMAMALPNKSVSPDEVWNYDIAYKLIISRDEVRDVIYRLRFKYLGTRKRNNRDEAVVMFEGRIIKGDGSNNSSTDLQQSGKSFEDLNEKAEREKGIFGLARGAALVDLETGATKLARTESEVAIDLVFKVKVRNREGEEEERELNAVFGAVGETALWRHLDGSDTKDSTQLYLPFQDVPLTPFVGVPDTDIARSGTVDPGSGKSSLGDSPGTTGVGNYQMASEVLERLKKQGCMIKAMSHDTGGTGSGWLAEPGIVITNAHVVNMIDRAARPPLTVEVFFEPSTPRERRFPAKILLVDYDNDLAVLQLPTKEGLPEPMPIVPSTELIESQLLRVVGFPMGQNIARTMQEGLDKLGTQMKIRPSSVAGRTENKKTGLLKYIRVEGGLISGNSGGAIVDMNGNVRCVAVAVIPDPDTGGLGQLGLAIPSEFAQRLLWGYPLEMHPKLAYQADKDTAKMPIEVKFGDPLKRVKKVWLDYWVGKPGLPRRSADKEPKLRPDDGERKSVECEYNADKMLAKGEFVLPKEIDPGFAYWIQPRFVDGTGQEKWGEAIFHAPEGQPVERKEVLLKAKFTKGSARIIEVDSEADYRYVVFGGNRGHNMRLSARLSERMLGIDPQSKLQGVEYRFDNVKFGQARTQIEAIQQLLAGVQNPQQLMAEIRRLILRGGFSNDGLMTKSVVDTSQIGNPLQSLMFTNFSNQVLEAIQLMSIKFPSKTVQYGETWEQPLNLHLETRKRHEPALYKLTMKYQGVRDRGGRREAVIEIKGSIARDDKAEIIDLKTNKDEDDLGDGKDQPSDGGGEPKDGGGDPNKDTNVTMQTPKPKDKPKAAPKEAPKPKDKGKDADKDKDADDSIGRTGSKRPLFGLVRGYAIVDLESGAVSSCQMYIDVDTEIVVKDPQSKADMPVKAGGTIELKMTRHTSDK